jgi:hypothetical protein
MKASRGAFLKISTNFEAFFREIEDCYVYVAFIKPIAAEAFWPQSALDHKICNQSRKFNLLFNFLCLKLDPNFEAYHLVLILYLLV